MNEEIEVLENGARQSKVEERYDLLPPHAMERLAQVLGYGAAKYGERNWVGIPAASHLNHARRHLTKLEQGDASEDHVGHALCRIVMWADTLLRHKETPGVEPAKIVEAPKVGEWIEGLPTQDGVWDRKWNCSSYTQQSQAKFINGGLFGRHIDQDEWGPAETFFSGPDSYSRYVGPLPPEGS